MKIDFRERSTYFKGLLLLIKQDKVIEEAERGLMQKVGKTLGFEREFIQSSIDNLLANQYITDDIPKFSSKVIAESFLLDGLKLAFSDNDFSPDEIEYLSKIAEQNGLDSEWFSSLLKSYLTHFETLNDNSFLFIENYLEEDISKVAQ